MEYNSNTSHEFEWFKGCNEQQQIWNGIDYNKELNHTKNENENFMDGTFKWQG